MRILIAEDDTTSRSILAAVLRKSGHEVLETVNGQAAWEALQRADAPPLAILDWMMPEMDGPEIVRRLRLLPTERPPYIIMLTAKGDKADIIAGLDAGANDYLSKPFDPGELRARVEVGRRLIEIQDALIESRELMAQQATHDSLTGLLNRRAILDRLQQELARTARTGGLLTVGVCDIDHFKQVNDTYGHQAGDDVLCEFSRILSESLRDYDCVGRMGGEEFLVVAPMKAKEDCPSLYGRLCLQVADRKIATRAGTLSITTSIGVAWAAVGTSVDEILAVADAALYRAKASGRNRVVYAESGIEEKS